MEPTHEPHPDQQLVTPRHHPLLLSRALCSIPLFLSLNLSLSRDPSLSLRSRSLSRRKMTREETMDAPLKFFAPPSVASSPPTGAPSAAMEASGRRHRNQTTAAARIGPSPTPATLASSRARSPFLNPIRLAWCRPDPVVPGSSEDPARRHRARVRAVACVACALTLPSIRLISSEPPMDRPVHRSTPNRAVQLNRPDPPRPAVQPQLLSRPSQISCAIQIRPKPYSSDAFRSVRIRSTSSGSTTSRIRSSSKRDSRCRYR